MFIFIQIEFNSLFQLNIQIGTQYLQMKFLEGTVKMEKDQLEKPSITKTFFNEFRGFGSGFDLVFTFETPLLSAQ